MYLSRVGLYYFKYTPLISQVFFGIRGYILAQAYQNRSELTFSLTVWYDSTTKTKMSYSGLTRDGEREVWCP